MQYLKKNSNLTITKWQNKLDVPIIKCVIIIKGCTSRGKNPSYPILKVLHYIFL